VCIPKNIQSNSVFDDYLFIKHIPKNSKMIINDSLQRIATDAILIGTNRDTKIHDIPQLMLYNGKTFNFYLQK